MEADREVDIQDTFDYLLAADEYYNGTKWEMQLFDVFPELEEYYIPCKAKIYLKKKMTTRSIMTILRQFLKSEGYYLNYWESYIDGVKITYYQIKEDSKIIKNKTYVVSFS